MQRIVDCYYPGSTFPAISVTGGSCALSCKHCARRYLEGMIPATSPEDLVSVAKALEERDAKGFLLSGGVDAAGKVPLIGFSEAVENIKSTTDLKINAHIGLASEAEIERLVSSGIDAFSIDIYGSNETIRNVLGLDARIDDYFRVYEALERSGAPVTAPHICVGIDEGRTKGELQAVERLSSFSPKVLILISLIPTKGTSFSNVSPPGVADILSVIEAARDAMPRTKLHLGCMRSKRGRTTEIECLKSGLDGIVLPASTTVARLQEEGMKVRKRDTCCALL